MFFIFGWGDRDVKELGSTYKIKCPNCEKTHMWQLLEVKSNFTLFFIPVFPYESKKLLICPVCKNAIQLSEDVFQKAKTVADIHNRFAGKQINEFEYKTQLENFYADGFEALKQYMEASATASEKGVHCPYCNSIAHTDTGGLFIDRCCTKCSKELPMHVINQVKAAFPEKYS